MVREREGGWTSPPLLEAVLKAADVARIETRFLAVTRCAWLQKPFTLEQVDAAIDRVMAEKAS